MRAKNDHLIRSVHFDTEADVEANASTFADAVSALDYQQVFGRVLEKYNGVNEIVSFDKIELDLGQVDINNLGELEGELSRLLDEALADKMPFSYQQKAKVASRIEQGKETANDGAINEEVSQFSIEEKVKLLIHYFKTGALPWNVTSRPDVEVVMGDVIESAAEVVKQKFLPVLQNENAVKRMVFSLQHDTILRFVKLYFDSADVAVAQTILEVIEKEISLSRRDSFKQQLAIAYLTVISDVYRRNVQLAESFLRELKKILMEHLQYISEVMYYNMDLLLQQEDSVAYQKVYGSLLLIIDEALVVKGEPRKKGSVSGDKVDGNVRMQDEEEIVLNANTKENIQKEVRDIADEGESEDVEEQIEFIDNAGLVLVGSYLPRAFKMMGWVDDGVVVDEVSRDKMLLWMDYLVWGRRKTYEYSLSLNKLLTGVKPSEVIDISIELTEEEMTIADDLLSAAIQHWSALKNTSIDGFRNAFLQRNGKFYDEDGGWHLHVENKPFDMLLDSLPWSFSIIRFSWMEKPLYTQWRTKA